MCDHPLPTSTPEFRVPGRYKLWEIPGQFHCAVIGTCLPLNELKRLLARAGMRIAPDADDYSLHSFAVARAGRPEKITKLIQKALDARWAPDIRRFGAASPPELRGLWEAAVAKGRIAGAFWALVSRRDAPEELRTEAYGTVHMLSHLQGGAAREDLKRLAAAERRIDELEADLAALRRAKLEAERARDARIAELEARLRHAQARAAIPAGALPAPEPGDAAQLRMRLERAERRLRAERARARSAEAMVERLWRPHDGASRRLRPVVTAETGAADPASPLAIEGRRVLYLGGRPGQVPHLRSLVERHKAQLLHHDGGIEQTNRRLDGLVEQADLVLCPVDCVSHEACLRAKRLCRRLNKPFIPLRGSGASQLGRLIAAPGN